MSPTTVRCRQSNDVNQSSTIRMKKIRTKKAGAKPA